MRPEASLLHPARGVRTHGLGLAHTHIRLNARQLHNAIRKAIGADHGPDDPSYRLSYLNAIAALIDGAEPAAGQFRLAARREGDRQAGLHDHRPDAEILDATQPIRFLIAETETGFTLLTALYFAQLFGVEDKVEISPLFETRIGLEQGARVIAEALGAASFRTYVRARGGFACRPASPTPGARLARSPPPMPSSGCASRSAGSSRGRGSRTSSWSSSTPMANRLAGAAIPKASPTAWPMSTRRFARAEFKSSASPARRRSASREATAICAS